MGNTDNVLGFSSLAHWNEGDREALKSLVPLLFGELRRVAHNHLRKARPGRTLQTTALVHEAYLRLEQYQRTYFQNRSHFLAICALLMRQILTGYERQRRADKRGKGREPLSLDDADALASGRSVDLVVSGNSICIDLQEISVMPRRNNLDVVDSVTTRPR